MGEAPILQLFNLEKQIYIETNALGRAIGTYLYQKGEDNKPRAIAYFSRKIIEAKKNYNIYD